MPTKVFWICDRCGKETDDRTRIASGDWEQLNVFKSGRFDNSIILCPPCANELAGWMNRKNTGMKKYMLVTGYGKDSSSKIHKSECYILKRTKYAGEMSDEFFQRTNEEPLKHIWYILCTKCFSEKEIRELRIEKKLTQEGKQGD